MPPPRRLRAPSADGALLEDPPLSEAGALLAANARALSGWDHDFQGRRSGRLRAMARARASELARAYHGRLGLDDPGPLDPAAPLVVTGHQPELFHPGVWVKNFAVEAVARAVGGRGLNFVVDNDLPKGPEVRVPHLDGDALRVAPVAVDGWWGDAPYEDLAVRDEATFASFGERARDALGPLVANPLVGSYWPRAVVARERTDRVGLRLAAARRETEAAWGVRNHETTLGALCESEPFLWFASHLLAHLPRFAEVHNAALRLYRRAHGIRSRNHPVADLARQGDWIEAPFWAWRARSPRRRPLLARQSGKSLEIRIGGEADILAELPLAPDRDACCAVERLAELPGRGVRLRTRALTTTMFARLILGDLFVHGIGGAKYDELGDEIVRGFLGIEPPGFLTLSLTLRLGLETDPSADADRERGAHALRDLTFNPDRHLDADAPREAVDLAEAKRAAIALPVGTRAERVGRLREIRRLNALLIPHVQARRDELMRRIEALGRRLRHDAAARSREYASVLHDEGRLRAALTRAVAGAG